MSTKKLRMGLNDKITNAEYHGDREYLSSSAFKLMLKSAADFADKYIFEKPVEELSGGFLDEGSLTHAYILEPEVIDEEFAFFPGFRKAGVEFQKFKAENRDKIIISASQEKRCLANFEAYKKQPAAVQLVSGGESEVSATGLLLNIPVKARADYINVDKAYIADVKTTAWSSDLETFTDTVEKYKYDLSAALYLDIFEKIYQKPFEFYFIVISKKEQTCDVFKLSEKTRRNGERMLRKAAKKYKQCKETGIWLDERDLVQQSLENEHYQILEV